MSLSDKKAQYGFFLAILGAVTYGTLGTWTKWMTGFGLGQLTIANYMACVLAIFFGCYVLITDGWKGFKVKKWWLLLIMFLHGMILINEMNIAYVNAYETTPVGIVSIIVFLNIFVIMGITRVAYKQKITSTKVIAAIVTILGLCLVLKVFTTGIASFNIAGLLWSLSIAVNFGIAWSLIPFYLKNGVGVFLQTFYINVFGAITLWVANPPWTTVGDIVKAANINGMLVWLVLLGYAAFPLIISYAAQTTSYYYIEATYVSAIMALDPTTASICGLLFFGEKLGAAQIVGILIILLAVTYMQLREGKEKPVLDDVLQSLEAKAS